MQEDSPPGKDKSLVIGDFIENYLREIDFYRELARTITDRCKSILKTAGIKCMVTYREKDINSLQKKLEQRNIEKLYKNRDHIRRDIPDFAGIRIALYFPNDREKTEILIRDNFDLLEEEKRFPEYDKKAPERETRKKKFTGYHATHLRVCLRKEGLNPEFFRFREVMAEIQIGSVLMHAWAEVEHDIFYKPAQPQLSEDEFDILDELNGLVLAGEIALTRLQRAAARRIEQQQTPFDNEYELGVFLHKILREKFSDEYNSIRIGNLEKPFRILKRLSLNTPESINLLLTNVHPENKNFISISTSLPEEILVHYPDKKIDIYFEDIRSQISEKSWRKQNIEKTISALNQVKILEDMLEGLLNLPIRSIRRAPMSLLEDGLGVGQQVAVEIRNLMKAKSDLLMSSSEYTDSQLLFIENSARKILDILKEENNAQGK